MIPEFKCEADGARYRFYDESVEITSIHSHVYVWDTDRFFLRMITTPEYMARSESIIRDMGEAGIKWSDIRDTIHSAALPKCNMLRQSREMFAPINEESIIHILRKFWKNPTGVTGRGGIRTSRGIKVMMNQIRRSIGRDKVEEGIVTYIWERFEAALLRSRSFGGFCTNLERMGKEITEHAKKWKHEEIINSVINEKPEGNVLAGEIAA